MPPLAGQLSWSLALEASSRTPMPPEPAPLHCPKGSGGLELWSASERAGIVLLLLCSWSQLSQLLHVPREDSINHLHPSSGQMTDGANSLLLSSWGPAPPPGPVLLCCPVQVLPLSQLLQPARIRASKPALLIPGPVLLTVSGGKGQAREGNNPCLYATPKQWSDRALWGWLTHTLATRASSTPARARFKACSLVCCLQ